MIIDYNQMEEQELQNFKGGEKAFHTRMFSDAYNKIMKGKLIPGASIGFHAHETGSEIIYILEGNGKVLYDGTEERVSTGQCHYCPKGHSHSLINDTDKDLLFFAVVAEQ